VKAGQKYINVQNDSTELLFPISSGIIFFCDPYLTYKEQINIMLPSRPTLKYETCLVHFSALAFNFRKNLYANEHLAINMLTYWCMLCTYPYKTAFVSYNYSIVGF